MVAHTVAGLVQVDQIKVAWHSVVASTVAGHTQVEQIRVASYSAVAGTVEVHTEPSFITLSRTGAINLNQIDFELSIVQILGTIFLIVFTQVIACSILLASYPEMLGQQISNAKSLKTLLTIGYLEESDCVYPIAK